MANESEKILKRVGKMIVTEMAMLVVVALLRQIRNAAEYILESEVKLNVS